jgi:hypothetical protein
MARSQDEALSNIRQYAAEARKMQDERMDVDDTGTEARLDNTLKELQARVQEQQTALDKV